MAIIFISVVKQLTFPQLLFLPATITQESRSDDDYTNSNESRGGHSQTGIIETQIPFVVLN